MRFFELLRDGDGKFVHIEYDSFAEPPLREVSCLDKVALRFGTATHQPRQLWLTDEQPVDLSDEWTVHWRTWYGRNRERVFADEGVMNDFVLQLRWKRKREVVVYRTRKYEKKRIQKCYMRDSI